MINENNRIGEERVMNCGMKAKIIAYKNYKDIDIQFEDGYIRKHTNYKNYINGRIKNPYIPILYGIGYMGEENGVDEDGKRLKSYNVWSNMLSRCYNKKAKDYKNYGGRGVSVCEEWHNYSNFKKWYDKHIYKIEGDVVHLDKDILIEGNNIYSPDTCIFVPRRINYLFEKLYDKELGVCWHKNRNKYIAQINIDGKPVFLGYYDNIEEAKESYSIAKNCEIKRMIEVYKDKIPNYIYNILLNKIN